MNKLVTYSARAKFRHLLEKTPGAVAMRLTVGNAGGVQIETLFAAKSARDVVICNNPVILTDLRTLTELSDEAIDFSYDTEEFIITRDKHVIPATA